MIWITVAVTMLLFAYLLVALLQPEWFWHLVGVPEWHIADE